MVANKEARDGVPDSLSHLTSQMPSPPPRPPSIASSTRSSSKRSSLASTSARQSKHLSAGETDFVVTQSSAPPTPSISNLYAGYFPSSNSSGVGGGLTSPSLGEEMAYSAAHSPEMPTAGVNGSPWLHDEASHSPRTDQVPTRKSGRSSSASKRKSRRVSVQRDREREGPSIVIRARSPEPGSPSPLGQRSISRESSLNGMAPMLRRESSSISSQLMSLARDAPKPGDDHQAPLFSGAKVDRHPSSKQQAPPATISPPKTYRQYVYGFFKDLIKTWAILFYGVLWPLGKALLSMLLPFGHSDRASADDTVAAASESKAMKERDEEDNSFAERFKYLVCTSFLLTSSLSISSYGAEDVRPTAEEPGTKKGQTELPKSVAWPREASCAIASDLVEPSSSSLVASKKSPLPHLTKRGTTVVNATLLALAFFALRARSFDAWCRAAVSMLSLTWATIIAFDMHADVTVIGFDVSHKSEGRSHLRWYDEQCRDHSEDRHLPRAVRDRIKGRSCRHVSTFIHQAQSFDVECNKAIAAIQEVELVARGYKLTHPLPPISRIEASNSSAFNSPLRNRQSPWASPSQSTPLSNARLSRSSSSGTSAASGWKHAPRPISNGVIPLSSGRESPLGQTPQLQSQEPLTSTEDPKRLAPLRKALVNSFEEANYALKNALQELEGLVDEKEMTLLMEMYEIGSGLEPDSATIGANLSARSEPWSAQGTDSIHSWTSTMPTPHSKRASILHGASPSSRIISMDDSITGTPLKRLSLRSDGSISNETPSRRAESFMSDSLDSASTPLNQTASTTPGRSSRLSYISEKRNSQSSIAGSSSIVSNGNNTGTNPNETGALKRLSYVSASSAGGGGNGIKSSRPLSGSRPPPLQISRASSPSGSSLFSSSIKGQSPSARFSLESRRRLSFAGMPNESAAAADPYRLLSLKAAFEAMHLVRKRALCCLLALDYSLKRKITVGEIGEISSSNYWAIVDQSIQKLSIRLESLAEEMRKQVRMEMFESEHEEGTEGAKRKPNTLSGEALLKPPADGPSELSGFEERTEDMASALRSVQVKLRACAEELKLRAPPTHLHGTMSATDNSASSASSTPGNASPVANGVSASRERANRIFEGIKEDLHSLSTYWEAAAKILRDTEMARSISPANSDTTKLYSPQEAEEDALRSWTAARQGSKSPSSSSEGVEESEPLSSGSLRGMPASYLELALSQERNGGQPDLSSLLVQEATPEHLPPPGMEKVYESMANGGFASVGNRPKLSREERIRQIKEQRAREGSEETVLAEKAAGDPAGMIKELQRVMQNRSVNLQQQQRPPQPPVKSTTDYHQLGSPLDLGIVDETGQFQLPVQQRQQQQQQQQQANGRTRSPQSPSQLPSAAKRRNRESTGLDGQILDRVDEAFAF